MGRAVPMQNEGPCPMNEKERFWQLLAELEEADHANDHVRICETLDEMDVVAHAIRLTPDEWTAATVVMQKLNGEVYAQ